MDCPEQRARTERQANNSANFNISLTVFTANTRSLKGKTAELSLLTFDYDVVCLTETHIDRTIYDNEIFDYANKHIYRKDRMLGGKGVLVAVNKD